MNSPKLIHLLVKALNRLPRRVVLRSALTLGRLAYLVYSSQRELALQNIRACFPEESHSLHERIAIRAFQHMVISAVDLLRFSEGGPNARPRIEVRDLHHVAGAIGNGRGVVLVTAHYGNVGVLPFALEGVSKESAYIMRRATRRVGWVVAKFRSYREAYLKPRSSFHPLESSIRGAVKAGHLLKRGNAIMVVADLTWGSGAISVPFLGIQHSMSRAPASLAILTGAALIPAITLRNIDGTYTVVVGRPIERPRDASRHDAERIMMETFAKTLERCVVSCPEQWFWVHHQGRR